jgi:hypothetical protein
MGKKKMKIIRKVGTKKSSLIAGITYLKNDKVGKSCVCNFKAL